MPAAAAAVAALTCPAGGRGWCAAVAGILEATTAKPGNVHPGASFPDLSHADLVAAAAAIAPVLERAATTPLGRTILEAVSAARSAADTNANLGIILLTAPLAAVPDGEPLDAAAVDRVLERLDAADAADVYQAIAIAHPGGLGRVDRDDVAGPPPTDLRAAMRAAAERDQIARLWAEGYGPLFAGAAADLATEMTVVRNEFERGENSPQRVLMSWCWLATLARTSAGPCCRARSLDWSSFRHLRAGPHRSSLCRATTNTMGLTLTPPMRACAPPARHWASSGWSAKCCTPPGKTGPAGRYAWLAPPFGATLMLSVAPAA
jgi:triphosphoribosyl-dephospho-CoA synthetase